MSPKNPARVPDPGEEILKGHDIRSLGPSDSSDTGADMVGIGGLDSTSDRQGTGERLTVDKELPGENGDIRPNRIVRADEAGLGGGLDQAEEAQLGVTDEEIEDEINFDDED
jgi:hypothetical protein